MPSRPTARRIRPGVTPVAACSSGEPCEWVVLAGGVIGATVVVPEFLYDVTDGSLGASGVLLVAGLTLLGGSLLGLRIRRTAEPAGDPPAPAGPAPLEHTGSDR